MSARFSLSLLLLIIALILSACAGGHRYHPCLEKGIETCPDWVKKARETKTADAPARN